jgi:hypothetical protein
MLLKQLDCRLLSALAFTNDNGITNCNRPTQITSFTSEITVEIRLKPNHADPNQSKQSKTTINNPTSTHSDPKQQKPADTKQSNPTYQSTNQSKSQPTKPEIYVCNLGLE